MELVLEHVTSLDSLKVKSVWVDIDMILISTISNNSMMAGFNMFFQCPGLVDSVHYVMHLLTVSLYVVTSGASPTDIELILLPKSHVNFFTPAALLL
jgi:hypothetical protein